MALVIDSSSLWEIMCMLRICKVILQASWQRNALQCVHSKAQVASLLEVERILWLCLLVSYMVCICICISAQSGKYIYMLIVTLSA